MERTSAREGRSVLEQQPDVAVVLLDVVMEEHDAGLRFVEWMRARGYHKQRIILRTGQPGYAPELDIIRNFDINDYRTKDELTQTRLVTAMTAAVRTFDQFWKIETAQRQAANEAARLHTVMNTVLDGIITFGCDGIIQSGNVSVARILGYDPDEILGQDKTMLLAGPAEAGRWAGHPQKSIEDQTSGGSSETIGRRKDGSSFPMEFGVSEMLLNGERVFVSSMRDITERKEMERVKDEFISTVSHELRTPLSSIFGSIRLLNQRADSTPDEQSRRLLELAQTSCVRLSRLVDDIIDLERITAGKIAYQMDSVEIAPLVRDIVESHLFLSEAHGITFETRLNADGVNVYLDANRFTQALVNLLSNAAKHSPRGGVVCITAEAEGGSVRISVSDNGPGIPKSFHGKVFERFALADASTTRKVEGSGIGLSITRTLIEAFEGKVTFDTEEGAGTTFHFLLPACANGERRGAREAVSLSVLPG